jgi:hypothetical protein
MNPEMRAKTRWTCLTYGEDKNPFLFALALCLAALPGVAHADQPTPPEKSLAEEIQEQQALVRSLGTQHPEYVMSLSDLARFMLPQVAGRKRQQFHFERSKLTGAASERDFRRFPVSRGLGSWTENQRAPSPTAYGLWSSKHQETKRAYEHKADDIAHTNLYDVEVSAGVPRGSIWCMGRARQFVVETWDYRVGHPRILRVFCAVDASIARPRSWLRQKSFRRTSS